MLMFFLQFWCFKLITIYIYILKGSHIWNFPVSKYYYYYYYFKVLHQIILVYVCFSVNSWLFPSFQCLFLFLLFGYCNLDFRACSNIAQWWTMFALLFGLAIEPLELQAVNLSNEIETSLFPFEPLVPLELDRPYYCEVCCISHWYSLLELILLFWTCRIGWSCCLENGTYCTVQGGT